MSKAKNMFSKIMIDVIDGGKPAIKVTMPNPGAYETGQIDKYSEDLRDKMVRMFFDHTGPYSSFVGIISPRDNPGVKYLVPMDIGQTLEWLHKAFANKIAQDEDSVDKVHKIFEDLVKMYHFEPLPENGNPS